MVCHCADPSAVALGRGPCLTQEREAPALFTPLAFVTLPRKPRSHGGDTGQGCALSLRHVDKMSFYCP